MIDPDYSIVVWEVRDMTCPNCNVTARDVPDVCGSADARRPNLTTWFCYCDACGTEWDEEETAEEPS